MKILVLVLIVAGTVLIGINEGMREAFPLEITLEVFKPDGRHAARAVVICPGYAITCGHVTENAISIKRNGIFPLIETGSGVTKPKNGEEGIAILKVASSTQAERVEIDCSTLERNSEVAVNGILRGKEEYRLTIGITDSYMENMLILTPKFEKGTSGAGVWLGGKLAGIIHGHSLMTDENGKTRVSQAIPGHRIEKILQTYALQDKKFRRTYYDN